MTERSNYITAEGEQRLRDELKFLWKTERVEVTKRVSDAAKEGDRSENAEYIYSKKRLREIDRRIRYLTQRLDKIVRVEQLPSQQDKIFFGAWVYIKNEDGEQRKYRIVGTDEFDMLPQYISIDAPMARALLGKSEGDEIELNLPSGIQYWTVSQIEYLQPFRPI